MSLLDRIIELLEQHFSEPEPNLGARNRNTIEKDSGNPTFEVYIYQTAKLSDKRGRKPEKMVAKYIAQAIADAGYDYKIDYGFKSTYSPPREDNSTETLGWWKENTQNKAATCNILLYDSRGGGRAGLGADNAIAGMNRVTDVHEEAKPVCKTQSCDNVWPAIHEFGHSLGGRHDTPMMNGKPNMLFSDEMKALIDKRVENGEISTI